MSAGAGRSAADVAGDVATFGRVVAALLAAAAFIATMGPPRRLAQVMGWRLGARAPVRLQRILCAGIGVRVRQHGTFSDAPRRLIVANHVSWMDVPVLGSLTPLTFLAKQEVGSHPLGRHLVALQGVVYVDRQRRRAIPAVNARMAEAMRAGDAVVLFAEATTGDGNRILRFRSSHFEAVRQALVASGGGETVVQPVYLDYSRLAGMRIGRAERPRLAWYGDMTFLPHLIAYLRGAPATCDVHCGPPIVVSPGLDRKTAARLAEAAVRSLAEAARRAPPPALPARREKY